MHTQSQPRTHKELQMHDAAHIPKYTLTQSYNHSHTQHSTTPSRGTLTAPRRCVVTAAWTRHSSLNIPYTAHLVVERRKSPDVAARQPDGLVALKVVARLVGKAVAAAIYAATAAA